MTSTNDGKDLKSNQTSGQKGKTYYIELYKSLEARLSSECSGEERTRHVCEAWRRVHCLCLHSAPSTHPHLLSWIQRHTSHTILQTEWQSPKSKEQHTWLEEAINAFFCECKDAVTKRDGVSQPWEMQLVQRARWFLTVLPNPWGHPVLKALLDSRGPQPSDREVLQWLKEERGVMFVTRLRQLAASKCDDLALLLATAVMNHVRQTARVVADADQAEEQPQDKPEAINDFSFHDILRKEAGFTTDVWELLTDIEFVLLYKGESRARCIELAKQTPLRNGYKLVERLHNRLENSPQEKKLWKNAKDVATLIAQVVIARCMVVPHCTGVARAALYGCVYSLVQLLPADKLPTAAAALAAPAATSRHLHTLAAAVNAQCTEERKPFVCSLYVRAITAGMNELEKLKLDTEKASEARAIEQTLASWFIQLGTLLSASTRLSCECTLTAFSVHPSPIMYERVKRAPPLAPLIMPDVQEQDTETNSEYGSWASDSRTQTNLVKTSETLKIKQTQKQANVLSTAIFAEGEGLGLEADLCQDLAVLLSGPRVKTLYWDMDREVLLENCRTYMERTHGGTRALTTELKYLNLDPNCFQHLPEEEDEDENDIYYGIEKGYEHLVEFEPEPEDVMCDDIMTDYYDTTDSVTSIEELPMLIPKRKKKKNKPSQIFSEEEVDPLSLVCDTLSENKDIPHSKERSKHKNKERSKSKIKIDHTKEHGENNEIADEITKVIETKVKKKQKKERKKKDKLNVCDIKIKDQKFQSSSNLSRLVGMKIARSNERRNMNPNVNACTTDSDYDSQGKSSINSEYNENALNDALNEALHSMDDTKPSHKTLTDDLQRTSCPPNSYTPTTITAVKEDVKRSIQKLIQYRRHNVFNNNSINRDSSESYGYRYSIDHDFLKSKKLSNNTNSSVIDNEGVKYLDTPHAPLKHHTAVKNESSNTFMSSKEGNFNSKKKTLNLSLQTTKDRQDMSANEKSMKKNLPKILNLKQPSQMIKHAVNKFTETPSQKQYQEFLLQRKIQDPKSESLGQVQFQEFLKKQYLQSNEPPVSTSITQDLPKQLPSQQINKNVTPSQVQFHNFLKDLQETINAGTTNETRDSKCMHALHDKAATKKIVQTKKVDSATNTYARLSYMHKNKQCESKLKVAHNPIIQNKPSVNVTPEQIGHIKDIDLEKISYLQSKGEIVLSKIVKPKNKCSVEKAKVLVQNIENISDCSTSTSNPSNKTVLSYMLPSGSKITDYTETGQTEIEVTKKCNMPTPKTSTSFLSEKDQFDLLLLLRQQNKMNSPKIPVKTEVTNAPSGILIKNSSSHCVNSEKQCLELHNKTPILEEAGKSTSCPTSVIKVTNSKTGSESKKNRAKGSKQKINNESDWKSVMDDLLAHRTPSMIGPNALDVVLKKDSFEKRSSECLNNPNYKSVITTCINKTKIINNENIAIHFTQDTQTASTSRDSSFNLKSAHTQDLKLEQDVVQSTNKIRSVDIEKKRPTHIQNKHFPSVIQNSYDPFISGILNSDYDLLEELMDDDLRQEIGELSSDEESYRCPNLSTSKTKNNLHAKESNLPITKTKATGAGNPFNSSSISRSDSVKKCSTNALTIVKKDLSLKSSSLPKEINRKNLDSNKCANLKPQIISNEIIASSTPVKKLSPSGKVCNNIFGTTMKAVTSNTTKLCVGKPPHLKINPLITSKTKSQNSINSVSTACNVQNVLDPAQVVLTVPQRNTQAQAQNIMLIGSNDLIYDPFTAIHQSTKSGTFSDLNENTYVAVNQAPVNVTLLHSTPFVGPVLSPVIIENTVTLPIIQKVAPKMCTNFTLLSSKNPEPSPICKNIQHLNKTKSVIIQSKTSNERHENLCLPDGEDLEAFKFKATTSRSTEADSEISTSRSNSKRGDLIAEMSDLNNIKSSIKQSQPGTVKVLNVNAKPESKVSEDKKCPVNERSDINELVDKTLSLDNQTDVLLDQERLKNKRLLITEKLENLKNTYHEKPIAIPCVPIKSSKQDKKNQEITSKEENTRKLRTRRKISDKIDSSQKQNSHKPTVFNDDTVIAQINKKVYKAKAIQNPIKKYCLSKDKNVPNIQKNIKRFKSNLGENNYSVKSKCEQKLNMEFKKSSNDTHYGYPDKQQQKVCKENIGELKESAKLLNNHVVKANENDISLKSVEIQTFSVMKNSCQELNISTETNNSSELLNCENIFKECSKKEPSTKEVAVNEKYNKCTLRKLTSQQNNVSANLTLQSKITHKEVKKAKISKDSSNIEKLVHDSVERKCVDIEEQILPVVKSTSMKSDKLYEEKISLVGDTNTTHEEKSTPLISIKKSDESDKDLLDVSNTHKEVKKAIISKDSSNIEKLVHDSVERKWVDLEEQILPVVKSTSMKSDKLYEEKISLVGDTNTTHEEKSTLLISIKKSDESDEDLLDVSNTHKEVKKAKISKDSSNIEKLVHDSVERKWVDIEEQILPVVKSTSMKSDKLYEEKISLVGDTNTTHEEKSTPLISIKKSDESDKDLLDVSNTHKEVKKAKISKDSSNIEKLVHDSVERKWVDIEEQILPVVKSTSMKSDKLYEEKISLVGDTNTTHDKKSTPLISIKKSDESDKDLLDISNTHKEVKKAKISNDSSNIEKLVHASVERKWVGIEEQILPVVIKSTSMKSDELYEDKISLVGDTNTTHDQKTSPLISIKKSDESDKDLLDVSNTTHDQIASPIISQNCTIKNSDELCKDFVGVNNTTHDQIASPVISQNCTVKKSDELCKDKIFVAGDSNTTHGFKESPLISQNCVIKKFDDSLVGDNNTTRGQKAPSLMFQNCTLKNSDFLGEDEISLVADCNTKHNQKVISENHTIEKSDELCKDKFSMVGDNTTTEDKQQSLPKTQNYTTKKTEELYKDNISLVVDNNKHDEQTRSPLICQNSALTKSDEFCTDKVSRGSGNITHIQRQKASLSQSNTIKNSDELVNDKKTSLENNYKPHEKKVPCPISQSMRVKDNNLVDKSTVQQKPTTANNNKKLVTNAEMQREQSNNSNSMIKTVDKDVSNNKRSLNLENDLCKSKNYNLLYDKITYDELPNPSNGSQKRFVRIKLANGNSFKATISGKAHGGIDSIFEDPTVKSLLSQNINNKVKCTLNIKQSKIQNKNGPPIFKNVVKVCPQRPPQQNEAETINLISDDEEDFHPQSFKTEFGNFNVKSLEPNIHLKHQKKLSQKSVVVLERYNVLQDIIPNVETNNEPNKLDKENIPSEKPMSTPETETDYIEIEDDSSNDSITLVSVTNTNENNTILCREKVDELKNLLLKDLGVELNDDLIPKGVLNKTQGIVENRDKIIEDNKNKIEPLNLLNEFMKNMEVINQSPTDIQTEALSIINGINRNVEVLNKNTDILDENKNSKEEDNLIESEDLPVRQMENNSKQVLLKLKKCDDLVEHLKIKKQKCFVSLIRCDDALQDYERKIESCTQNKETDESVHDVLCLRNEIRIAAEPTLKRSDSESILNALDANTVELSLSTNNMDLSDPMSPSLIDNFDIPINLTENILNSSGILVGLPNKICDADWFVTKSFLNKYKSLDNPYRVSLEIFKECETDEDSLTDCDSDLDVSLSKNESVQVPSLVKLIVNLLANDPHVLERHIDKDLKSEIERNTNSSPLKRKANECVEIRPQSKLSKIENHFSSEILYQSKQNCHSIVINNTQTQTEYASKSINSKDVLEFDCKIKESRNQASEVKDEIQNDVEHMQYNEVASLLQIAIKSFQVMSEIKENLTCVEDISCSSNSIRALPKNVNEEFCFDKTSGNNATIALELEVKNVHDENILRTRETLSEGEQLKKTCSFDVSEDAIVQYSEINENISNREHSLRNSDTCTDLQSNGEDMPAKPFLDEENNADDEKQTRFCSMLTKTRLLSQHDTEDSPHMNETTKGYDTETQIHETQTDTSALKIPKDEQRVDNLKINKKCSSEYLMEHDSKLPEIGSTLLSKLDVYDVNGTLRRSNCCLDVDVRTRENEAKTKLNEENTKVFKTSDESVVTEIKTVDSVGSKAKSKFKLEMDQAWKLNEKNSTCSEYENIKPCSLVKTTDDSHKDLVSSRNLTQDLKTQDALQQNEHGGVFNSTTNSNKVNDYVGRSRLEMTATSSVYDDTQEQETDKNDTAYMKNKVNAENQENNKLIAFANKDKKPITPLQQIKQCNSKLGLESNIFVDKSFIDIEVKQSATQEVHAGTTNLAQDTKLLDKTEIFKNTQFKNDQYSHENCVNVTFKDLETPTQTPETSAELHQKFDIILEDTISPSCSLKELEIKIVNNSEIRENDTYGDKNTSLKTFQVAETNVIDVEISDDTCISKKIYETLKLAENNIVDAEFSVSDTSILKQVDKILKLADNNSIDAEISKSETITSKEADETLKLGENNSIETEMSDSDIRINKIDETLKLVENNIMETGISDSGPFINKEFGITLKIAENNIIDAEISDSNTSIIKETDKLLKLAESYSINAEISDSDSLVNKEIAETSKLAENNMINSEILDNDTSICEEINETLKLGKSNVIAVEIADSDYCKTKYTTNESCSSNNSKSIHINDIKIDEKDKFDDNNDVSIALARNKFRIDDEIFKGDQFSGFVINTHNERNLETVSHETNTTLSEMNCDPQKQIDNNFGGLNTRINMKKAFKNFYTHENINLSDHNEDMRPFENFKSEIIQSKTPRKKRFDECFPDSKSESVCRKKAANGNGKLEESFQCNFLSKEITTKITNLQFNISEDIGNKIYSTGIKKDAITYESSEYTTPDTNNINENNETEKKSALTNNPVSSNDKRMDNVKCNNSTNSNENSEGNFVNSKTNLTNESTESENANEVESSSSKDNKLQKNVTLVYKGDSNVILKDSIYEDPVVGICYVIPARNRTSSTADEINCSNVSDDKTIYAMKKINSDAFEESNKLNVSEDVQIAETFNVVQPKVTYSRQRFKNDESINIDDKTNRKILKRKHNFYDHKFRAKRYRKGKNIDYPKFSVVAVLESAYSKEFKRLLDYCTSVKFSYSRYFLKEYIDVSDIVKGWPIKEIEMNVPDNTDFENTLFSEEQFENKASFDPLQQTLAEEISQCNERQYTSCNINETNFNMGFGEGSDRVIQISDGNNMSKVSAATLSDVKQSQPCLTSEEYGNCDKNQILCTSHKHQIEILKRSISYIKLRDKVRSFFKKTTAELNYHRLMDTMKSKYKNSCNNSIFISGFPYDLISSDFIEPPPVEAVVQVVQVGQLPVSAAAQNPVTCDPRVTQVTDASPQCSIENGPHDDSQSPIKTEYTELTTADLSLPLVHDYDRHMESQESSKMLNSHHEDIPVETEITSIVKTEITVELSPLKEEPIDYNDSDDLQSLVNKHINNVDYSFDSNDNSVLETQSNTDISYESLENQETDFSPQEKQQSCSSEKTDQIAHAMNAAGITTTPETNINTRTHSLVDMLPQKNCQEAPAVPTAPSVNNYSKNPVNAMTLQQALAQILPPPLNQTNVHENNQTNTNSSVTSQVLHIVQGKNTNGNQITLVDNSQNSVISNTNTPVLHIVQNKGASTNSTSNANSGQHTNSYSGLSLVDAGIQQGSNQLLHIVNTGNQKNNTPGQLLKRVNLLTNLTNVQGSNEQKMVQFVCKSADGKSIHLNAPHQRSMVLRLQPIESANIQTNPKATECQDNTISCPTSNTNNGTSNKESSNSQHEIKSRSVYEENYAKFIQNSSNKSVEKSTSLPKFGQAFGKQVFQDGNQKGSDINTNNSNLASINSNSESSECQANDNSVNLDHIGQINSPPLLLRKSPSQPAQSQSSQGNLVQQIKQTIAPMNIQTMHGGVIYTRQIPVNIGGGQTINLITVPSTEFIDEANQKQKGDGKLVNQNELESPIIKIVPQNQSTTNAEGTHDDTNNHSGMSNENAQNTPAQHQTVLTQMRIKLPMLSKTPQMVSGARVVRPSFFQIQRNVIGGANQHVYQQLVLTAAPPLGQHTIRLPQAQASRQTTKTTADGQATSEPQMSSSTLEQLREFDMVLEQVKERSTVQPNSNSNSTFNKMLTPTTETSEGTSVTSTVTESTQQVLYSIGSNQSLNVAYINRKTVATTPTTSTFVRSPDSTGIIDTPSSSHVQIPHTVTSESTLNEMTSQPNQPKPAKVGSKSKSRPKSSSNPPNSLKINTLPPKPTQKPLEDEQTTQRILYILAEYKEQVENSPDKDKPAPRRRSNPPTTSSGSSKRKKSSSGSRRPGARDMSPVHGEDTCRTMGSEDSSCGTSQGDCNESCLDSHSPQDSPRKVVRKLTFENETSPVAQPRPQPQRNVIVADGQTITVARGATGKPATAVLMPANYILPVSMVKGGQQIAIVTNRGPKLLTVAGGEGGATNALLLQRLIGPAGLKPVLTRPGVRHVRLPTAALHNLQAFNLTTATTAPPPDSTASPASAPTPPELVETRANSSPWTDRESQDVKPERESSPEGSEPWNLPSAADPHDYTYEETVRTDNMDRTVLESIPDRYSPDMEAQRIFDKMFDVESKKSYIDSHDDSSRCAYDIDASDCDDKVYHQVVHKKDGTSQRHHRLTQVSAAALRHKYAILEHELRLQKSLSEECEDLGVDSPSASELFPEAELLFAASPAHDAPHHSHTPQPTILNQSCIPQPDIDDQIATDELLQQDVPEDQQELDVSTLGLDEGIVTVSEDGMQATIALDQEEFARSHPNTTFHSEPTDEGEVQPFTIAGLKGRHITSTIFHAGRAPATVLVTAPQTTVISQANPDHAMPNNVKYANMDQIINSSPVTHGNLNMSSVLVKDDGLTKFDNILTDSRELHLSNTASAIVHSTGNATQVIRRVCYEDDKRDTRFLMDEPDALIAGDDAKMIAEDSSRDATLESIAGDVDDDNSSPERHAELFWESNSASERSESRRPMDFSSDSEKCCKSPSYDETNSTDSSGVGTHMRLDSVIKDARGIERSGSADGSSADDTHPPLRTYPAKRMYHALDGEVERSMSGKTRAGERSPDSLEVRRRASGRGVVKRGCHCCTGSPAPPRPKKSRQRKPAMDFTN